MTDSSFDHVSVAAAVRDAIKKVASNVVAQEAPKPQFGRVISVNFVALTATVWFPGDPTPVSVKLFSSVLPGQWQEKYGSGGSGAPNNSLIGYGSRVAVETLNGTQYITQVLNGGQFSVDFTSAGNLYTPYGVNGDPLDPVSGDYSFTPTWDTYGSPPAIPALPSNGGPFAINIGPFYSNRSSSIPNSTYEAEVIMASGMSQKYEFNTYPYYQTAENGGPTFDRWFRLIPKTVDEAFKSNNTGRSINSSTFFDGVLGIGDWVRDNVQSTVTLSQDFSPFAGGYSMKVVSNTASTGVVGAREGTGTSFRVIGNSSYLLSMQVYSPTLWSDVRAAIDWYNSSGTFISTFLPAASSIAANTWTSINSGNAVAPSNAAYAVPRFRIGATPPTTQAFYMASPTLNTNDASTRTDFSLDFCLRTTIHGSTSLDPNQSPGELWLRIYIHWLDATSNPSWTVRLKSTAGYSVAKSSKTGKPVYEYDTNPTDASGYLGYHDSSSGPTWHPSQYISTLIAPWSTGPWRNPDLTLAYRAQEVLSGGGMLSWDGTNFKWTAPFEVGGIGRSRHGLTVSSARITMPITGGIPIFPGGGSALASSSGIPLQAGQSLWFGIPPGLASSTIPNAAFAGGGLHGSGGLFIVDSSSLLWWSPPEWAVFVAYRQTDTNQPEIKCGNGQLIDKWRPLTLGNGWTNRGGIGAPLSYKFAGATDRLEIVGHIVPGTTTDATVIATLPVGFRPVTEQIILARKGNNTFPATLAIESSGILQIFDTAGSTLVQFSPTTIALDK